MAANMQILLLFACIIFIEAICGIPHHAKKHPEIRDEGDRYNQDGPMRSPEDQRPINGDIFSYNTDQSYHDYYRNGYPVDPYLGNPELYGYNFDHMPSYGMPDFHNPYRPYRPGQYLPNRFDNDKGRPENPDDKPGKGDDDDDSKKKVPVDNDKHADVPKTNENKNKESPKKENDKPIDLNAKKDYLLVDNNGHRYLLHENQPNVANNVVYVPITQNNNPQQPTNQVYQVVNGQPIVTANVPMTANKLNSYGNVITNPAQGYYPTNYNPASVYIYVNGQLIQVPGVVVNSPQNNFPRPNGNQGSNILVNSVPNNRIPNNPVVQYPYNVNANQGVPMTNTASYLSYSHNLPNTGVAMNTQPNNNGVYVPGNRPVSGLVNTVNSNPSGIITNPVGQPAVVLPGINNANVYQTIPAREKEPNAVSSPAVNAPAGNLQPVTQPAVATNNKNDGGFLIQPAIMVSGFKDKGNKDDKKEIKNEKEKSKEEIKKKE